jgi:hypothetical protein
VIALRLFIEAGNAAPSMPDQLQIKVLLSKHQLDIKGIAPAISKAIKRLFQP